MGSAATQEIVSLDFGPNGLIQWTPPPSQITAAQDDYKVTDTATLLVAATIGALDGMYFQM